MRVSAQFRPNHNGSCAIKGLAKTDNVIANSKNLLQVHIYGDRPYICTPFLVGDEMTKISVWAN